MRMRHRWLFYVLIGLVFGFIDWYFLAFLASISQNQPLLQAPGYIKLFIVMVLMIFNYGVWLIPAIPVAVYEMKCTHSYKRATISAVIVWCMALVGYYAYYAYLLMFVGLPNFDFMLFTNRHSVTFWADWWPPFKRVIVDQFFEWILVGLVGGTFVGILSAHVYKVFSTKRKHPGSKA